MSFTVLITDNIVVHRENLCINYPSTYQKSKSGYFLIDTLYQNDFKFVYITAWK